MWFVVLFATVLATLSSATRPLSANQNQPPPAFFNCSTQPSNAFLPVNIANSKGTVSATMIAYGATVTHLHVLDGKGVRRDVILGWDDPTQYCSNPQHTYFGATIGRVANRIAGCSFDLEGKTYNISCNEEDFDTLHGGVVGWDRRIWYIHKRSPNSVTFYYISPDGEMGFPGSVTTFVTHTITEDDVWTISYNASTNGNVTTVLAMTNHAYFNLNANIHNTATVLEHVLTMPTMDRIVEVSGAPDYHLIPTGKIASIAPGSALDFSHSKAVGDDIDEGLVTAKGGYDNAWVFPDAPEGAPSREAGGDLRHVCTVTSPLTNITMKVSTDQASVQIYTGNNLNGTDPALRLKRKYSQSYGKHPQYYHWRGAMTFETQGYPDAVHHSNFPSIVLKPGSTYVHRSAYAFSVPS